MFARFILAGVVLLLAALFAAGLAAMAVQFGEHL